MSIVEYLDYNVVAEQDWSLDDENLFEKARSLNELDETEFGEFQVKEDESILEAAERNDYKWPYGCRQGMCFSCGSYLYEGSVDQSEQMVLSEDEANDGYRVTCIGEPTEEHVKIVFNAQKKLYGN